MRGFEPPTPRLGVSSEGIQMCLSVFEKRQPFARLCPILEQNTVKKAGVLSMFGAKTP